MDDILVGLLILVVGASVCFLGLRIWFLMLPIWGFVAGFFLGATGVSALLGDGFLGTVAGWLVGIVVGLGLALLSTSIWYAGVLISVGSVGALLGSGLMRALGVDGDWLVAIAALAGAGIFVVAALMVSWPTYAVVFGTAFSGAVAAVTGAMLLLNRVDLDDLRRGSAWALIQESWVWVLVWIVVAALGASYQLRSLAEALLPVDRWTRARRLAA